MKSAPPTGVPLTDAEKLGNYLDGEVDKLMKLPGFRFFLQHVIQQPEWCGAYGNAANVNNVNDTYRQLGRQHIGQQLMVLAQKSSPDLWMRMLPEALETHHRIQTGTINKPPEKPKE